MTADLSTKFIYARKEWNDILKLWFKKENWQSRNKCFPEKQKLTEFTTTRPESFTGNKDANYYFEYTTEQIHRQKIHKRKELSIEKLEISYKTEKESSKMTKGSLNL